MFKKFVSFLSVLVLIMCFSFTCAASVRFDGVPHNEEWADCELYYFDNPRDFNNSVNHAFLRVKPDFQKNQFYLCVYMQLSDFENFALSAVSLEFDDDEKIILNGDGKSSYDSVLYNVEYGVSADENTSNIIYEIRVGFKIGVPNKSELKVVLTDTQMSPSNVFAFQLEFDEVTSVWESSVTETEKSSKRKSEKTSKTKKTSEDTQDSFTFEKVQIESEQTQSDQSSVSGETSVVNLTENVIDNKSRKEKIYIAVGAFCALALVTSVLYSNIKKSKKSDSEQKE